MNKFSGETYAQMSTVNIAFFEGNPEDFLYIINFQKVRNDWTDVLIFRCDALRRVLVNVYISRCLYSKVRRGKISSTVLEIKTL